MKWLVLALFIAASLIHLKDSWTDDAKKRAYTKPLLLLFLLLFYLTGAERPWSVFLILALLSSWLGDVLLIPKGHQWFKAGGISFMLSHFFFILVYMPRIRPSEVVWIVIIAAAVLYFGVSRLIISMTRPTTPENMAGPMAFYLICNSTMNLFALMQVFSTHAQGAYVAYAGAILFFVSDCALFLVRYYKDEGIVLKKHFTVMLTYLAGEFLIALGMMMLMKS